MKRLAGIAFALVVLLFVMGCGSGGLFGPEATITSFTSTKTNSTSGKIEVETDETFTLTVEATTHNSAGESDLTDYSGNIAITSNPTGITGTTTATFDKSTTETFSVSFPSAGDYSITATVTDSKGGTATSTLQATVTAPPSLPWDGETVPTIGFQEWNRGYVSSTGYDWYKKSAASSTYYIYYFDDGGSYNASVANITVRVYGDDGTTLVSGDLTSPTSSFSTSGYSDIYIKVECSSSDYGYYYIAVTSTNSVPTTGSITRNGGSTGYLSAGEIEVWYYDVTSSEDIIFQWEGEDTYGTYYNADGGSYTLDIAVSGWSGDSKPLFYEDTTLYNSDDHEYYISSYSDLYMIVSGDASSDYGSYYVDID